ncbi:hypothetical protein CPLU01_16069, partial [Colletotrichum plurivorum]
MTPPGAHRARCAVGPRRKPKPGVQHQPSRPNVNAPYGHNYGPTRYLLRLSCMLAIFRRFTVTASEAGCTLRHVGFAGRENREASRQSGGVG